MGWVALLREESDSAPDMKGRRLSQITGALAQQKVEELEIKVVSRMRMETEGSKSAQPFLGKKKMSIGELLQVNYAFDFGVKDWGSGKFRKVWTKSLSEKEWRQVHKTIKMNGLLKLFGTKSAALKWPDTYRGKTDMEKTKERALDLELYLHALLNMVDLNAIRANAAPWVCVLSLPQLHDALGMPKSIAQLVCQIGYRRKVLAFGEDPEPEWSGVAGDFDVDKDVEELRK